MRIKEIYKIYLKFPFINTDSRKEIKGSIFFALKGDTFNGNKYALDAINKGASYAVVDQAEYAIDERFILVDDVLNTLQKLASFHRENLEIKILAITGTNGKTTTKELVTKVLSKKYQVDATIGNLNNHIGVPLTLLSLTKETQIGVVEMGANHIGEITKLCEIAQPDYGIITNVGKAHLEGFGSFEGVKKAKSELYFYLEKHSGKVFVNANNTFLTGLMSELNLSNNMYGQHENASCYGELIDSNPTVSLKWQINSKEGLFIRGQMPGAYNFENIMAAICVGSYFEVQPNLIKEAIEEYIPENNRSQVIQKKTNTLLLDAYNANPTSMQMALENFVEMEKENGVLILGDMFELGETSMDEHQQIIKLLEKRNIDQVLLVGKEFSKCKSAYQSFETVNDLKNWITLNPIQSSFILIKGSRGVKLEKIVDYL